MKCPVRTHQEWRENLKTRELGDRKYATPPPLLNVPPFLQVGVLLFPAPCGLIITQTETQQPCLIARTTAHAHTHRHTDTCFHLKHRSFHTLNVRSKTRTESRNTCTLNNKELYNKTNTAL